MSEAKPRRKLLQLIQQASRKVLRGGSKMDLAKNMPILPPELLQEIVSHLSGKVDTRALRSTSLAARAFRAPCQEILFSEILLEKPYTHPGSYSPCGALLKALGDSPNLLTYVKSVIVRDRFSPIFPQDTDKQPPLDKSVSTLICLLSRQRLELVSVAGWRGSSTPEFQEAVLRLIGCPSITVLELDFLQIDIIRAISSSHITKMALIAMYGGPWGPFLFTEEIPQKVSPGVPVVHLKQLSITEDKEEVNAVLDPSNNILLGHLQDLHIHVTPEPFVAEGNIAGLLSACAPSLRRLNLDAIVLKYKAMECLPAFGRMVHLEEFNTDCCSYQKGRDGRINLYGWLPDVISALPSPNRLGSMSIFLRYHSQGEIDDETPFWHQVDKMLASQDNFPHFGDMLVKFPALSSVSSYRNTSAENLFPTLSDAGLAKTTYLDEWT
ncbi:hypothetical protein BKA70DRAFT_1295737 [Coprinopsis sp. MPI-PUGE-AT-0042]|nr:hypothetical protein BKA70DRAFT_1295737 [Coprinopsis sp. MPI-PUGE-AT-0042]